MNILVTGGAGFIGSHVSSALLDLGYTVSVLDNLDPYYPVVLKEYNLSNLESKGLSTFYNVDIRDKKALHDAFAECKPEIVLHLAAKAGVRNSVENPGEYIEVNVLGTHNVLEIGRKFGVTKFMIASSSSVYGSNTKVPFSEGDTVELQESPYASSKRAMEVMCKTYAKVYGVSMQLFRFFTVYGPSGRPDMAPILFTKAIDQGKPITVFGSTQTKRDYTYIEDIVSGLIGALSHKDTFSIYNIGNNTPVTLQEFIDTIASTLGKKPVIIIGEKRVGDVEQTWADISKAHKEFGYIPKHTLARGIEKSIAWYTKHTNLYI